MPVIVFEAPKHIWWLFQVLLKNILNEFYSLTFLKNPFYHSQTKRSSRQNDLGIGNPIQKTVFKHQCISKPAIPSPPDAYITLHYITLHQAFNKEGMNHMPQPQPQPPTHPPLFVCDCGWGKALIRKTQQKFLASIKFCSQASKALGSDIVRLCSYYNVTAT